MSISALTELWAVYDVNKQLAKDLSERFHARTMDTFDELLSEPRIDAVYIAVPHYLLAPLARQALETGKHVLAEKPLGISLAEVDQLIELASERQLALGVFYEMRYAPAHALARKLIQAGAIGDILGVQIQTLIDKPLTYWQAGYSGRSVDPWRMIKAKAGGGVVLMNTSHLLDALFFMTDLAVKSVAAEIGSLVVDAEVEDTASATLRFSNGALGSLIAGAHIVGAEDAERCAIYGTEGQLQLPDPYGAGPLRIYLKRSWNDMAACQWHSISLEPAPVYRLAVEDFARAVQSEEHVPIDGRAARRILEVVLAIYQSAAERRSITLA
jgi:predicted dehydrogenase